MGTIVIYWHHHNMGLIEKQASWHSTTCAQWSKIPQISTNFHKITQNFDLYSISFSEIPHFGLKKFSDCFQTIFRPFLDPFLDVFRHMIVSGCVFIVFICSFLEVRFFIDLWWFQGSENDVFEGGRHGWSTVNSEWIWVYRFSEKIDFLMAPEDHLDSLFGVSLAPKAVIVPKETSHKASKRHLKNSIKKIVKKVHARHAGGGALAPLEI